MKEEVVVIDPEDFEFDGPMTRGNVVDFMLRSTSIREWNLRRHILLQEDDHPKWLEFLLDCSGLVKIVSLDRNKPDGWDDFFKKLWVLFPGICLQVDRDSDGDQYSAWTLGPEKMRILHFYFPITNEHMGAWRYFSITDDSVLDELAQEVIDEAVDGLSKEGGVNPKAHTPEP